MFSNNFIRKGLRNASYLFFGNFLALFISLFGIVYISGFLGPEKFGSYSLVFSFVSLFTFLTLPGIDRVNVLSSSKNLKDIPKILSDNILLKIGSSFLACLITCIFCILMPYSFETQKLIIMFSSFFFFTGILSFFSTVLQAHEKMQIIAYGKIFINILFVLLSFIFLNNGFGVNGVLVSRLIPTMILSFFIYIYSLKLLSISRYNFSNNVSKVFLKRVLHFTGINLTSIAILRLDILI